MLRRECPYCDHVNPSGSKFCNACGAPLHLLPCKHCGAVNDAAATVCRECGAALSQAEGSRAPGGSRVVSGEGTRRNAADGDVELFASLQDVRERLARIEAEHAGLLPDGEAPHPDRESDPAAAPRLDAEETGPRVATAPRLPSRRFELPRQIWLIVAGVALLAGAVGGYYFLDWRQSAHVRGTHPVVRDMTEDPAGVAAVPPTGAPTTSAEAAPSTSLTAPSPAAAPDGSQAAAPAPPIAGVLAAEQGGAPSPATAKPRSESEATEASAPPQETESSFRIVAPPPARLGPCTEAVAALGLCTLEHVERKD